MNRELAKRIQLVACKDEVVAAWKKLPHGGTQTWAEVILYDHELPALDRHVEELLDTLEYNADIEYFDECRAGR